MKMNRQRSPVVVPRFTLILGFGLLLAVTAFSQSPRATTVARAAKGQSVTMLSDGSWLFLGGETDGTPSDAAIIRESGARRDTVPAGTLSVARAWHTATVTPDGSVVIVGGIGVNGQSIASIERFDPQTGGFSLVNTVGVTPRSRHTATLLSDGQILIVGGISKSGKTMGTAQLLDTRTGTATKVSGRLAHPRSGHSATLMSNGDVLIQGGVDSRGVKITANEIYDPGSERFTSIDATSVQPVSSIAPTVTGSIPADGAKNVAVGTVISIRFSEPINVTTVNSDTVTLGGPEGIVITKAVAAEGGRLVFVTPALSLVASTTYTVTVDGVVGADGVEVAHASFSFTTSSSTIVGSSGAAVSAAPAGSSSAGDEAWVPSAYNFSSGDWRSHRAASPWQSLPALLAPKGTTALSGQILTLDGMPLANVALRIGQNRTRTDPSGRFLLPGLAAGHPVLIVDGTKANTSIKSYGIFEVGVYVQAHVTNVLPFTIWMPLLDLVHAATIPSPTTKETVISTPLLPGLELHLPAGTVIRDISGKAVTTVSITPVPIDRPPFPLPAGVEVPIYFTIQPGGAYLEAQSGSYPGAWLSYPNLRHSPPGARYQFWNYNPDRWSWYIYGGGSVGPNGTQIVPDPGVRIYEFTGAMVASQQNPVKTGDCQGISGAPVDCSTGTLIESHTDMTLADVIPLKLTRTYLSNDNISRPFGIGATDNYEMYFTGDVVPWTYIDLILPDGQQVHYQNTSGDLSGTGFLDAYYVANTKPGPFYGSTITWDNNAIGWRLKVRDGTTYIFPESSGATNDPARAALLGIVDRHGNNISIYRDSSGNVTQIASPSGRWIQFQHDSNNRITQVQDILGRTVKYVYDAAGRLQSATDPNNGVTSYTYDGANRMLTVTNPRNITTLKVQYDTSGRVNLETLADNTTWQYNYTTNSGAITQATITDPRGIVEKKTFNDGGFVIADTSAAGLPEQQAFTLVRDANTNLITSVTDQLGRQTAYDYDAKGNVTSITRQAGTSQAVTTSFTYEPTFNQPTSVTDPLGHTWVLSNFNITGDPMVITDPLGRQTTLTYNSAGQPLTVTDAANDKTQFSYLLGEIASITDPLGNKISRAVDGAGRLVSLTDALGNATSFSYDVLDRPTQITDAKGGMTTFGYDTNGNYGLLTSLKDANNNTTNYPTYDSRDRLSTRTDALNASDTYAYDGDSNLTQHTDRNGNVTVYQYDGLNRRTFAGYGYNGSTYTAGTVSYTWDGGNRLTKAVDSVAGTINRQYDGLDRLTQEQTPQGIINYTYDGANRRATMAIVGQSTTNYYCWDNANRLAGINQQPCPNSPVAGFTYDNANRRTCLSLPNGVLMTYGYDSDSHITSINYWAGGTCASPTSNLGALSYAYDADGRRTGVGGSLAAVNLPTAVAQSTTGYNVDNEQTSFGSASSLTYDANGNLKNDGTNVYTWDARNHLSAIGGGATASFVYDALGRRISKTVGGTVTQFQYDGLNPVEEFNGTGGLTASILTGLSIDEYFSRTDSSGTVSFLTDALGSTIGLSSGGSIGTSYTYQPFGATTVAGSNANPYQFSGRENDGTGLYFYRARYYSPTLQRFIAQDPIGYAGDDANLYAYVYNSAPNLVDPFGLWGIGVTLGGGGAIGTGGGAAGTSELGIGIFVNGWHLSVGTFATAGGVSTVPHTQFGTGTAHGLAGDYGLNLFVTTANCVQQLKGPFVTGAVDAGLGPVQIGSQISVGVDSSGQPVVVGSVSPPGLGETVGVGYADYITQTVVLGSWNIF